MFFAIIIILVIFVIAFGISKTYMNKIKNNPEYQKTRNEMTQYTVEDQLKNGQSITMSYIENNNAFNDIKEKWRMRRLML